MLIDSGKTQLDQASLAELSELANEIASAAASMNLNSSQTNKA